MLFQHSGQSEFPFTNEHLPVMQDMHDAVHAVSQHTPSLQNPLTHAAEDEHFCPLISLHWPLALQLFVPLHSGVSGFPFTAEHVPLVHNMHGVVHAVSQHTPSLHFPLRQTEPEEHFCPLASLLWHLPLVSQILVPLHSGLSSLPVTAEHVPVVHDIHGVAHAVSQQAPSLHCPLAHAVLEEQICPLTSLHCALASQLLVPLHSGVSTCPLTARHFPVAHDMHGVVHALSQHTPSLQCPLKQSETVLHFTPLFPWQTPLVLQLLLPAHSGVSAFPLTARHVPVEHDMHGVVHAVSQHTPSLHCPLAHAMPEEHF